MAIHQYRFCKDFDPGFSCSICGAFLGTGHVIQFPCRCVLHYQQLTAERIINPKATDLMENYEKRKETQ